MSCSCPGKLLVLLSNQVFACSMSVPICLTFSHPQTNSFQRIIDLWDNFLHFWTMFFNEQRLFFFKIWSLAKFSSALWFVCCICVASILLCFIKNSSTPLSCKLSHLSSIKKSFCHQGQFWELSLFCSLWRQKYRQRHWTWGWSVPNTQICTAAPCSHLDIFLMKVISWRFSCKIIHGVHYSQLLVLTKTYQKLLHGSVSNWRRLLVGIFSYTVGTLFTNLIHDRSHFVSRSMFYM